MKELYEKLGIIQVNPEGSVELGLIYYDGLIEETEVYLLSKVPKKILDKNIKDLGAIIVDSIPHNKYNNRFYWVNEKEDGITIIKLPFTWLFNVATYSFFR